MNISDNGVAKIKLREGERLVAYLDTKGIPTIGVGHTGPEVKLGMRITPGQSMAYLKSDLKTAEDAVNKNVKVALTQNQYDALVSFVFNVGVRAFSTSTLLKVLNMSNYKEAAAQFNRWVIPPEITKRRMDEKEQFLSP